MRIVKNFKKSRQDLDYTQGFIARDLEVHYSTVSGWETEKDPIPLRQLIKYANKYNFSLDYLFGLTSKNEKYEPLNYDLKIIASNLKILRKKNNMTQKEVANYLGTSQSTYSSYETGNTLISTTFLHSLTSIYEPFSIDELLGRKKMN